ncbi:MAG: hypothetical protein CMI27_07135 [Opitutae bacterium]|nr:hypothetical protein [Opitutae bacterium]
MTNSIFRSVFIFLIVLSICPASKVGAQSYSATNHRIPSDSFLLLSMKTGNIIDKSSILTSKTWNPILEDWRVRFPLIDQLLIDPNASGLKLSSPIHFFARLQGNQKPSIVFGLTSTVNDPEKIDQNLSNFAENLGFEKKMGKFPRFANPRLPYEIGRKNNTAYIIGIISNRQETKVSAFELQLDQLVENFFKPSKSKLPESLRAHLAQTSDLSLYWDGTGFARLLEDFLPAGSWKNALPAFDTITHRPVGIHFQSSKGSVVFSSIDYLSEVEKTIAPLNLSNMIDLLPGDAPILGRLSFETNDFQVFTLSLVDEILKFLSGGNFTQKSILPGFDVSIRDMLSSYSGDFLFAGGDFKSLPKTSKNQEVPAFDHLHSSFALGARTIKKFGVRELLAGLNSSNSLDFLLEIQGLKLLRKNNSLWLSSRDYVREIEAEKPIKKVSKAQRKFLQENPIAVEIRIDLLTQSLRKTNRLSFIENKTVNILDDFLKFSIRSEKNRLLGNVKLRKKNSQGWEVLMNHLGQELIDRRNQGIYRAIALNNFESLTDEVKNGALINANDRFGHSPLHYSSYKGNLRFVDYLLRNGGNPNTQGKHNSTPLHSAAWGRHREVLELLLEDGADVNARTEEGETPCMTAALRGEKEILEILFALSADPHAIDIHGSNMLDLAAAGGHSKIVKLLTQIGVSENNPMHIAAGLGDIDKIKKLLKNGSSINQLDGFGATPLLIAVVSGKEEMVDFLLSQNADPTLGAKDGYTMMHGAAFSGKKSMVRKALSYDLEVNPRYGKEGITPVDIAEDDGDALPYLRALGGKTSWELGPSN